MSLSHPPTTEYSRVTDQIYLGTSMCCKHHADYHYDKLAKLGIYADIDLRIEAVEEPRSTLGAHLWLPIVDTYPPTIEQMKLGISFIKEVVEMGKKVYVHCEVGHGRSPTLVISYFMLEKGMSLSEAIKFVKERRPEVHPTDKQMEFLKSLKAG